MALLFIRAQNLPLDLSYSAGRSGEREYVEDFEGIYDPGLEAAYMTFFHIPLARTSHRIMTNCQEIWEM